MTTMYYENDADLSVLEDKTVGIIGYGSQGHAHALNLMDSGLNVKVGLYEGSKSWDKAESAGLTVGLVADVARDSDVIMVLIPDTSQAQVYGESIRPHLDPGKTLMFAHGFNIHYKTILPPPASTCRWWPPRRRATGCARCSSGARESRACLQSTRTSRGVPGISVWPTPGG